MPKTGGPVEGKRRGLQFAESPVLPNPWDKKPRLSVL